MKNLLAILAVALVMRVKHKMPPSLVTESRPIRSFKGAIKITKLK